MTTTTPDHNTGICHAASENRRQVLEHLQLLAQQLEDCETRAKGDCDRETSNPRKSNNKKGSCGGARRKSCRRSSPPCTAPPTRLNLELGRTKSRDLIGGTLYTGCDCVRRNGLQDKCKRLGCQGRPECMTRPEPTCAPSQIEHSSPAMDMPEPQRELERPYLRLCCRCPDNCAELKQQRAPKEDVAHEYHKMHEQPNVCCYLCDYTDPRDLQ